MPQQINRFNKTRLAPTPSGYLHFGNVLSFAITAQLAKKNGAKILLRIDDLDQARVNKLYLQDIFDTLNFLEIQWDEGPRNLQEFEAAYSQIHRMPMYQDALNQLAGNGLFFACTCSRSQLEIEACSCYEKNIPLSQHGTCWRLLTDASTKVNIRAYNESIVEAVLPKDMHNFIVRKKDGFPAYQLTSVIDDLFFGVDLVVRGEDLRASTIAQHVLARALAANRFSGVSFYHHPLIMAEGKKLSKSAGAISIHYLRENGKKPADIYALIAGMLGIDEPIKNWEQLGESAIAAVKQ